ncbi:MAG: zinc ABC transporter substrate-binding protein [Porticoccus sp.]
MNNVFTTALLALVFSALPSVAASKPVVLASIKPVAMLVKAVVGDELSVELLLEANVSPHDYALKFSDIRAIKNADLVVWVGPELEGVLIKPLSVVPFDEQLQLTDLIALHWPNDADGEHEDHGHGVYTRDPHIWLNPKNSSSVVMAIAEILKEKYPEQGSIFEKNASDFILKINEIDSFSQNRIEMANIGLANGRGFVVTHDGYGHFVDYYGLNQLATIQLASGGGLGARRYGEIVAMGDRVTCVFGEPQLNNKPSIKLASQLGANWAELDLMGSDITLTKESYLQFFSGFTETFLACLEKK